jgi:hypothetical protein
VALKYGWFRHLLHIGAPSDALPLQRRAAEKEIPGSDSGTSLFVSGSLYALDCIQIHRQPSIKIGDIHDRDTVPELRAVFK